MAHDFDVVVVGSGFGGAVAACRLAEDGYKVVVLERGRRWQRDDYPAISKKPEGEAIGRCRSREPRWKRGDSQKAGSAMAGATRTLRTR